MKTIIASLKAEIEATKKTLEITERERERAFDLLSEGNKTEYEKNIKQFIEADEKYRETYNTLRCLRHALAYLRDALHEEYDSFQPEIDR